MSDLVRAATSGGHFVENRRLNNTLELSQTVTRRFSTRIALNQDLILGIQTVCLSLDPTARERFLAIERHNIWKALQILDELIECHVSGSRHVNTISNKMYHCKT